MNVSVETAEILLKAGADPNVKDKQDITALGRSENILLLKE